METIEKESMKVIDPEKKSCCFKDLYGEATQIKQKRHGNLKTLH